MPPHITVRTFCLLTLLFLAYSPCALAQYLTKEEMVRSYPRGHTPYELEWGLTEKTWNQQDIFLTVHKGARDPYTDYVVRVYHKQPAGYKQIKVLTTDGIGWLRKPNFFWYDAVDARGHTHRLHLLQLTIKYWGTGSFTEEHIFEVAAAGDGFELRPVEYIPAPTSYAKHLAEGEAVWKGENNSFSKDGLAFEFFIWRTDADANCCPSGGRVNGRYKLIRQREPGRPEYRIEMDSCERIASNHLNP